MYDLGQYRSVSHETTTFDFPWLDGSNKLLFTEFGSSNLEIITITFWKLDPLFKVEFIKLRFRPIIQSRLSREWRIRNRWYIAYWIRLVTRNRMVVVSWETERYWPRSYILFFKILYIWKIMWYDVISTFATLTFNSRNDFDHFNHFRYLK